MNAEAETEEEVGRREQNPLNLPLTGMACLFITAARSVCESSRRFLQDLHAHSHSRGLPQLRQGTDPGSGRSAPQEPCPPLTEEVHGISVTGSQLK